MIIEYGAVGGMRNSRGNEGSMKNLPLYPPQISHGLA
jgi:hypothetical protein